MATRTPVLTGKLLLSVQEAAILLGQTRATLYRAIRVGTHPFPIHRVGGRMKIPPSRDRPAPRRAGPDRPDGAREGSGAPRSQGSRPLRPLPGLRALRVAGAAEEMAHVLGGPPILLRHRTRVVAGHVHRRPAEAGLLL